MDHVVELRWRLLKVVGVFFAGAALGYLVRGPIIQVLQRPLGETLYFTSPMGSFTFVMQVCALIGVVIALPVLIYQLLKFIEPAFTRPLSRRLIITFVVASYALAAGGVAFAYFVGLPAALKFFTSVGTSQLHPLITIDEYFRFLMSYLITFAVAFQLPLVLLLIDHVTPLGPTRLRKWRKFVVVGAFGVALVTPSAPDPLSQIILAFPLILLYELSVILVAIAHRRRTKRQAAPAQVSQTAQPTARSTTQPARTARRPAPAPRPRPTAPAALPAASAPRPAVRGALDLRDWAVQPVQPQVSYNIIDLRPHS